MTRLEKGIYNCYLAVVRSGCGKPYRLRKKWEGFEEKPEYYHIKKLANFFTRHDNIDMTEFFKAPFMIYPEPANYDIKFYTTLKAAKCYKIFKSKKTS